MDTSGEGWIKVFRKLLDNPIMKDPEGLQLFIYGLLRANHRPTKIIFNGKELTLERGQFVFGLHQACRDLGSSMKKTRSRTALLENLGIWARKRAQKFSIVSVCNYDIYQGSENEEGHNKGQAKGTMRATDKNVRIKEFKNIYCNSFESISSFLSSLSEYQIFSLEVRELVTEFINNIRASNKTKAIQGGRVLQILTYLKGIQNRTDPECLLIGLKAVFRKKEKDGFDFKKSDPTGYIAAVAKSHKAWAEDSRLEKMTTEKKKAMERAPEGEAFLNLKTLIDPGMGK